MPLFSFNLLFCLIYVCASPYFFYRDAFMHHALHALDASGPLALPYKRYVQMYTRFAIATS